MIEIFPTEKYLNTFQSHRDNQFCKTCHQEIPGGKPKKRFWYVSKGHKGMIRIKVGENKTLTTLGRDWFEPFEIVNITCWSLIGDASKSIQLDLSFETTAALLKFLVMFVSFCQ